MFISHYTIIYFFVNNFFSNVYISVNTIFECSYLSFGWEIGHPLSIYVTRGMDGGHPKGGEGYHASCVRTHLYYLFPCFCHMVSCFICRNLHLRHVIQYICAIVFKRIFLQQPYGRKSYPKCVHILAREGELKNRWKKDTYVLNGYPQTNFVEYFLCVGTAKYTKVSPPARKMSLFSSIIITINLSHAIIRIYIILHMYLQVSETERLA